MKGRADYIKVFSFEAPSSQGVPSTFRKLQANEEQRIYWNRPPSAAYSVPPTLLHPIFGEFMDDCLNHGTTPVDNSLVFSLWSKMSDYFPEEIGRVAALRTVLREHGINTSGTTLDNTKYTTDGDMQISGHRYVILEVKNEIASGSADPYSQAVSYYTHSTHPFAVNKPGFRFPCFLITLFGKLCALCRYLR